MAASDTSPDAARLLRTRGLRALVDGLVAVVLPVVPARPGLHAPPQVGAIVTATLLGSAAVTLTIGLRGGRFDRVHLLQLMAVLMIATGLAFGHGGGVRRAARGGGGRHDQPVVGRRQRLPADRAGAAARHRAHRAAHPRVRPLQPGGLARRRVRRAGRGRARVGGRAHRPVRARRRARRVLRLRAGRAWCCSSPTGASRRARRWSSPGSAGAGSAGRGRSCCGCRRCSASTPSAAGSPCSRSSCSGSRSASACPPAQSGAVFFWSGLLTASSALLAPRHRRPHRADPHDGVHARARQPAAHLRRAHADRRASPSPACWPGRCCRRWMCPPARAT